MDERDIGNLWRENLLQDIPLEDRQIMELKKNVSLLDFTRDTQTWYDRRRETHSISVVNRKEPDRIEKLCNLLTFLLANEIKSILLVDQKEM